MANRDKWLKIRISEQEQDKLKRFAESKGWSQAQAVRDWIRRLPKKE
jgi:protein-arginine kinase activator protein McsA